MTMKELADLFTAKAVESRLAEEKASQEGQTTVAAMYDGQTRAYMDAAEQTGATTGGEVWTAIEEGLYGKPE